MKIVLAIINFVALVGAVIWWVTAPDWEPGVTSIGLFGALIAQIFTSDEFRSKIKLIQKSNKSSNNYQASGNQTITDNKKTQNGGDGSQQIQTESMIVNVGIDEKRAREVFQEMNLRMRQEHTQDALVIVNARVSEFENILMTKMEKVDGALEAFTDPSFQLLLIEAQKTAATERPVDYDLLSESLIHRFQKEGNRIVTTDVATRLDRSIHYEQDLSSLNVLFEFIPFLELRRMAMDLPHKLSLDFFLSETFYDFRKNNPQSYPFWDEELTRLWDSFVSEAEEIENFTKSNICGDQFFPFLDIGSASNCYNTYVGDDLDNYIKMNKRYLSEEQAGLVEQKINPLVQAFVYKHTELVNYIRYQFEDIKW